MRSHVGVLVLTIIFTYEFPRIIISLYPRKSIVITYAFPHVGVLV
jgi:hypothetical protein